MIVTSYEMVEADLRHMDYYIWEEYFQERDLGHIDGKGNKIAPYFSLCLGDCATLINELIEHSKIRSQLRPAIAIQSTSKGFTVSLGDLNTEKIVAKSETIPLAITLAFYFWVKEKNK